MTPTPSRVSFLRQTRHAHFRQVTAEYPGRSDHGRSQLVATADDETKRAKIAGLLLPGLGTVTDLKGRRQMRMGVHCGLRRRFEEAADRVAALVTKLGDEAEVAR